MWRSSKSIHINFILITSYTHKDFKNSLTLKQEKNINRVYNKTLLNV